ncbi:zinc transport system permease protein [Caloramator fervidus]|uniref:Zinc transport system permease protein n=1 Tax=Caloramator fervidus TaxID=29344 RepID=A0A1H5T9M2_9CLOT|nr:iron chelate uptake ABC transporter family permease subunit [Caloramator fervidus]SEF59525.1 zinc transport system permease protein [Caloramator fervidus]
MLKYTFMQRAFIAGIIISIIAPLIGNYIILKRFSQIGDTLSHSAILGVALGLLLGINPLFGALAVTIFFALALERLRRCFKGFAEISLSIITMTSLAFSAIVFSRIKSSASVMNYLFGSIIAISKMDLILILMVAIPTLTLILLFRKELLYICFDEDSALVSGINVKFLNLILNVLVALVIGISLRIVGGFLISALLVMPGAVAMKISSNFSNLQRYSILVSLFSVVLGIIASFYLNISPGGSIVSILIFIYLMVEVLKGRVR